jgi:hypothetical protein
MLSQFSEHHQSLVSVILRRLAEGMSGWWPRSTKTVGLPKLSREPQKPVSLGTVFRNGDECTSGILMFQEIVQDVEVTKAKEHFGEKSLMPNGMEIPAYAMEAFPQIKVA